MIEPRNKAERREEWRSLWVVIQREMRETAWRKRTFITRALSVILLGTVFSLMVSELNSAGMARRYIFMYMAVILTLFLAFVLPILVSDVIAAERERGTLGLLFLTPLRPLGIVLGKATGRLLLILSFMVACAPVVALTYLLGGVEAVDILKVFIAAFFSVIWGVTFCLWMSARSATVMGSTIACYAWGVIALGVLPMAQGIFMFDLAAFANEEYVLLTFAWHPFLLWMAALEDTAGIGLGPGWFLIAGMVGNLLISLFWFGLATEKVRRFFENPGLLQPRNPVKQHADKKERTARAEDKRTQTKPLIRSRNNSEDGIILDWINHWKNHPEIWLELRNSFASLSRAKGMVTQNGCVMLIFVLAFLLLLIPSHGIGYAFMSFQSFIIFAGCYIALIAGAVAAAGSVAREAESGRLDLILTTPLSPTRFLLLKALKIFLGVIVVFLVATFYIGVQRGDMGAIPALWIWFFLRRIVPLLLLMAVVVWVSLRFELSPALTIFVRALKIGLGAVLAVLLVMLFLMAREGGMSSFWVEYWLAWFAPWLALMGVAFWISSRVSRERTAFELTFGAACVIAVIWMTLAVLYSSSRWEFWIVDLFAAGGTVGLVFLGFAMFEVSRKRR